MNTLNKKCCRCCVLHTVCLLCKTPPPSAPSVNNRACESMLWGRNGWHYFNPSGAIFITCPLMRQEQLPVAFHNQSCLFRAENALWYLSLPETPKFTFHLCFLESKSRPDLYHIVNNFSKARMRCMVV